MALEGLPGRAAPVGGARTGLQRTRLPRSGGSPAREPAEVTAHAPSSRPGGTTWRSGCNPARAGGASRPPAASAAPPTPTASASCTVLRWRAPSPAPGRRVCWQAAVWTQVGEIAVEGVPEPQLPADHDVIREVRQGLTCGSDLHPISGRTGAAVAVGGAGHVVAIDRIPAIRTRLFQEEEDRCVRAVVLPGS